MCYVNGGFMLIEIVVDEATPVCYIHEQTVFPKVFIVVADNDIPCRLEQNLMFLKTMKMFGCPSERAKYKLMEGYKHCAYDKTKEFAKLWKNYMDETT